MKYRTVITVLMLFSAFFCLAACHNHTNIQSTHDTTVLPSIVLPAEPHLLFSADPNSETADLSLSFSEVLTEHPDGGLFYGEKLSPRYLKSKALSETAACRYGLFSFDQKETAVFSADIGTMAEAEALIHLLLIYRDRFPLLVIGHFEENTATLLKNVVDIDCILFNDLTVFWKDAAIETDQENRFFFKPQPVLRPFSFDKPSIALTYDDGPSPYTEELLSAFTDHSATATFYVTGDAAEQRPDMIRMIAASGCEIGNHSNLHEIFSNYSDSLIRKSVETANSKIRHILGIGAATVRPPTGDVTNRFGKPLSLGYPIILWSVDTRDFTDTLSEDELVDEIMKNLSDGAIILMHDTHRTTVSSADKLLNELHAAGYQTVTVSEMIEFYIGEAIPDTVYRSGIKDLKKPRKPE